MRLPLAGAGAKTHLRIYGQYTTTFEVALGDIDLDGEAELLLYMDTSYSHRTLPTYGGCEVYSVTDDGFVHKGGFLQDSSGGDQKLIRQYWLDPQGDPVIPMQLLWVSDEQVYDSGRYGLWRLTMDYTAALHLTDFAFSVLGLYFTNADDADYGYYTASPAARGIIPDLREVDAVEVYRHLWEYGFTPATREELDAALELADYTGPFDLHVRRGVALHRFSARLHLPGAGSEHRGRLESY